MLRQVCGQEARGLGDTYPRAASELPLFPFQVTWELEQPPSLKLHVGPFLQIFLGRQLRLSLSTQTHILEGRTDSFQILVVTRSRSLSLVSPAAIFPLCLAFSLPRKCCHLKTWNIQSALLVPRSLLSRSDPSCESLWTWLTRGVPVSSYPLVLLHDSLCISQDRPSYAAVTNTPKSQWFNITKCYLLLILCVHPWSAWSLAQHGGSV